MSGDSEVWSQVSVGNNEDRREDFQQLPQFYRCCYKWHRLSLWVPVRYLGSKSLRSGLGLEEGVRSSLEGKAVLSSSGLGVLVQFCQGFCGGCPEDCKSLSWLDRWLPWKGSVWVSSSKGTPTIRSCLRRGRRPCVDWLRGLEPSGGFPWLVEDDWGSRGDSSASKPVLS